jgi:hypothetical protein
MTGVIDHPEEICLERRWRQNHPGLSLKSSIIQAFSFGNESVMFSAETKALVAHLGDVETPSVMS